VVSIPPGQRSQPVLAGRLGSHHHRKLADSTAALDLIGGSKGPPRHTLWRPLAAASERVHSASDSPCLALHRHGTKAGHSGTPTPHREPAVARIPTTDRDSKGP
jgi:hypothetical protein